MAHDDRDPDRTMIERIDPRLGSVLAGRYRIEHKLAAGGFGAVYRGTDAEGHAVAIKVLHPELASDPSVAARFRREAAALATLADPHTVTMYDAGEAPDGTLFLVMELLSGESLYEHYRARGPLPWRRVVAIARGACSSLAEAHALGIVHRDLKPANIHLEHRGDDHDFVKVLDFGIAKALESSRLADMDLTQVGQMIGTYDYMPPEQMIGTCQPESDVFTLGVVMYEMIAGRRPFGEAKGPAAQLAAVLGTTPAPLENVPDSLARIILRCLAREPEDRYPDAGVLAGALDRFATDELAKTRAVILEPADEEYTVVEPIPTPVPMLGPTILAEPIDETAPRPRFDPAPTPRTIARAHAPVIAMPAAPPDLATTLPLDFQYPRMRATTLPGIAMPRPSSESLDQPRPRFASGTSPIVDRIGSASAIPAYDHARQMQRDRMIRALFLLAALAIAIAIAIGFAL